MRNNFWIQFLRVLSSKSRDDQDARKLVVCVLVFSSVLSLFWCDILESKISKSDPSVYIIMFRDENFMYDSPRTTLRFFDETPDIGKKNYWK